MPSITLDYQWFAGESEDESLLISPGIVMVTDETVILPHTLLVRPASQHEARVLLLRPPPPIAAFPFATYRQRADRYCAWKSLKNVDLPMPFP
jgi:hypothetical protein